MYDNLKGFIASHGKLFVYDTGLQSLKIMSGLVKDGIVEAAFVVNDSIENVNQVILECMNSKTIQDISYIANLSDKNDIGIILAGEVDYETESKLILAMGLTPDNIFRDTYRPIPDRLFRYMSPWEFIKMVTEDSFEFSNPNNWDDKYEGILFHAMQKDEGRKTIVDYAQMYGAQKGEVEEKLRYVSDNTRCKCLSGTYDSVVMWSAYDYDNKGVMIEISRDDIEKADERILLCPIKYVNDNISLTEELREVLKPDGIITHSVYTTKRASFSYEDEIRAFYRARFPEENTNARINIEPSRFIKNVLIHPKADDFFESIIESLCKRTGIKFSGKSHIFNYN